MSMNFAFRVDSSSIIGTGHVMRCLTLAEELRERGHDCVFLCRDHKGNVVSYISQKGFEVKLESIKENFIVETQNYNSWLGSLADEDANLWIKYVE